MEGKRKKKKKKNQNPGPCDNASCDCALLGATRDTVARAREATAKGKKKPKKKKLDQYFRVTTRPGKKEKNHQVTWDSPGVPRFRYPPSHHHHPTGNGPTSQCPMSIQYRCHMILRASACCSSRLYYAARLAHWPTSLPSPLERKKLPAGPPAG